MLETKSIYNSLSLKSIAIIVFILISFSSTAQVDSIPKFYYDSKGKLFIATGAHVSLYVGTSQDASKSIRLKGDNGNNPIHWSGHGLKHLTHLNLYLGRRVSLDLFADAFPPKTLMNFDSKRSIQKENKIYLSGQCIIELNAIDTDAGLNGIYYSLNEGSNVKYIEPIALKSEGEYKLSVFALDNVGNKEEEIIRTIVVDNTPPLTHLDLEGDKFENIISGRSSLSISSVDALGVKQTFYSIDSCKEKLYTNPIKATTLKEGEHSISWYSIDEVENIEATKSFTFFVDKTPPMVFEEIFGNTYIVAGKEFSSGRSQLRIAAVDNKSGIKEINYSLNNSAFKVYEKPVYLSDILGTASVKSFAIDNVGNHSISDTQSEAFTMPIVDITGPQISYNFIGLKIILKDTLWISPKTKISILANDIGAGVNRISYKIKGGEEKPYTEPFMYSIPGIHNVVCTAYDNVDNVNLISFNFGIDNQAPVIFYHFSIEPSGWLNVNGEQIPIFSKGLKLYLAATDNKSGVDWLGYCLNGAREVQFNSPIERFKVNTTYSILIKATDVLRNTSENTIKFRVE
jgi:hypothetical protein